VDDHRPDPEVEEERLAAVRRYDVLDTPPDGAFERLTALAAKHFDVPIAIVSIVDSDRIWFKSHHGIDVDEIDRDPGLCASAVMQDHPWVVEDAAADPRTIANPLVAGELGLRFYAGAPLTTRDGHGLGTLCVIDQEPREFTAEQADTLADMAAIVMDELELRLAARQTVEHELGLREQAERMARTLQESLLPPSLPEIPGADIAAFYRPAAADVVGGDFYDVFQTDAGCVATVGDVSGKGPAAAAVTALARHTLRSATLSAQSPADALTTLNRAMFIGHPGTEVEAFCTVLLVWVERSGTGLGLTVASAGHLPALVLHEDGSTSWLEASGPPVGWYPDAVFRLGSGRLTRGESLVLLTDGITEARTPSGMLGSEGLARGLAGLASDAPASTIVGAIAALLAADGVDVTDDAAALVIKAL